MNSYIDPGAEPRKREKISILAHRRSLMTKTWLADGSIKQYGGGKYFDLIEREVTGIRGLSRLLARMESKPRAMIVRGRYVGDELARKRESKEYREGQVLRRKSCFEDQPLHTILVEVDGFHATIDYLTDPVVAAREYIETKLPACFHRASFRWQLSSSAGHASKAGTGMRIHLWFWLSEAQTSAALRIWAKVEEIDLDAAVFNVVQPHYTAAPIFEAGVEGFSGKRSGFFEGQIDEVPLKIDPALQEQAKAFNRRGGHSAAAGQPKGDDPIYDYILSRPELVRKMLPDRIHIYCPARVHDDCRESSSTYFKSGVFDDAHGVFICQHDKCRGRWTYSSFLKAIGYQPESANIQRMSLNEAIAKAKAQTAEAFALLPKTQCHYADLNVKMTELEAIRSDVRAWFTDLTLEGEEALADEARVDAIERRYDALHSSIAAAMDPPVPVLRSEAGIGKTHLLIEEVATAVLFASSVVYAVQKHSNAIAVAEKLRELGVDAKVWRGYTQPDHDDPTKQMCLNLPAYRDATAAGVPNIAAAICRSIIKGKVHECPFYNKCGMVQQRKVKAQVWVVVYASIFVAKPETIPPPELLVLDDFFAGNGFPETEDDDGNIITRSSMPVEEMEGPIWVDVAEALRASVAPDVRGVSPEALAGLDEQQICKAWRQSENELRATQSLFVPGLGRVGRAGAAKDAKQRERLRLKIDICRELNDLKYSARRSGTLTVIEREVGKEMKLFVNVLKPRKVHPSWREAAHIVHADWTAPKELLPLVLGRPVDLQDPIATIWPDSITRTQMLGVKTTTSALGLVKRRERGGVRARIELRRLVVTVAMAVFPECVLLVCSKALGEWMKHGNVGDRHEQHGGLPSNVAVRNFASVVGLNDWEEAAGVITIGSPRPLIRALEDTASAFLGYEVVRIPSTEYNGKWVVFDWNVPAGIEMSDGSTYSTLARTHPDSLTLDIMRVTGPAAREQAQHRLRPIRRAVKPGFILDIADEPIVSPASRIIEIVELADDSCDLLMVEGMLPESGTDCHRAWPGWDRKKAPDVAILGRLADITAGLSGLQRLEYRVGNRRGHCWWLPAVCLDPDKWLKDRIGGSRVRARGKPFK